MTGAQTTTPAARRRRTILLTVLAILVAIPVGGGGYWALACPCDRTPGLYVRGTEATGELGPDLTGFAGRKRIGAGTAANTVENRRRFVRNAGRMKPGVQMPAYETLPEAELDAIVAYLGGLR